MFLVTHHANDVATVKQFNAQNPRLTEVNQTLPLFLFYEETCLFMFFSSFALSSRLSLDLLSPFMPPSPVNKAGERLLPGPPRCWVTVTFHCLQVFVFVFAKFKKTSL